MRAISWTRLARVEYNLQQFILTAERQTICAEGALFSSGAVLRDEQSDEPQASQHIHVDSILSTIHDIRLIKMFRFCVLHCDFFLQFPSPRDPVRNVSARFVA
ncbi:hypothetical protein [Methylocystis heyeri]|uniref:Uncharacterized protein n=1 Tax=Methylocystis heyeri TaxID=391905 RepID=A0A6B8KLX0_9HYPH|nr:hypothetical protein [Methylocystis heyeri]QGM47763.1 hypothetical protein H2LOC_019950 [Methylocystis heyeri]